MVQAPGQNSVELEINKVQSIFLDQVDFSLHTSSQIRQIFLLIIYFFLDQVFSSLNSILLPAQLGRFFSSNFLSLFPPRIFLSFLSSFSLRSILSSSCFTPHFFHFLILSFPLFLLISSLFPNSFNCSFHFSSPSLCFSPPIPFYLHPFSSSHFFSQSFHLLLSARIRPPNPSPILCVYCQGQRRL